MRNHFARFVTISNVAMAMLAIAWAYVSYRLDSLYFGRGSGNIDLWESILTLVAYTSLAVWLIGLIAITFGCFSLRLSKVRSASYVLASALIGPALVSGLSWWLYQSIP